MKRCVISPLPQGLQYSPTLQNENGQFHAREEHSSTLFFAGSPQAPYIPKLWVKSGSLARLGENTAKYWFCGSCQQAVICYYLEYWCGFPRKAFRSCKVIRQKLHAFLSEEKRVARYLTYCTAIPSPPFIVPFCMEVASQVCGGTMVIINL